MAFLDNSGDIILDAVLTDEGRRRLAKGDGSFNIVKFALGDDEINYGLYDGNNVSGSAYYDLTILQTPVLEAFTNNVASMNNKLVTISRTNLLYLPILKVNTVETANKFSNFVGYTDSFLVSANQTSDLSTDTSLKNGTTNLPQGVLSSANNSLIRVDQGLDTTAISYTQKLENEPDLFEDQYEVVIDSRLGSILDNAKNVQVVSNIDDDQMATYLFGLNEDPTIVKRIDNTVNASGINGQTIAGPRGTRIEFSISPSVQLTGGDYLFDLIGSSNITIGSIADQFKTIRSTVKVTGVKTGYSVVIPVVFVTKQ
jgi:hypothetical protein